MKSLLLIVLLFLQRGGPTGPAGVIRGTVLYSDGTPAGRILLRLTPVPEPGQQPSNARGLFTFTDPSGVYEQRVAPGRYTIRTDGAEAIYYPGVKTENEARVVVVTAGSTTEGLNISLPLSASGVLVQGRVKFPPNYPIQPTALRVEVARSPISSAITEDGTFEFTHVVPGSYPLIVTAPGAQPFLVTTADRDVTGIELDVPPLIPVRGTVTLEDNGPRPRLPVQIEGLLPPGGTPTSPPYRTIATATPDGAFSATVPPGEYRLIVSSLPGGYYLRSMNAGATNLLADSLKVAPTDSSARISITLGTSPGIRVTGKVKSIDDAGSSTAPEKITFTAAAVNESVEAVLDADGAFNLPKIAPGTYNVRVMLTPNVSSPPAPVVLPNRDLTGFEVQIPYPQEILGKVAVDGNGPPPKFPLLLVRGINVPGDSGRPGELPSVSSATLVNLILGNGRPGTQVLQLDVNALPDGSFKLKVPEGDYRVVGVPPGLPPAGNGIPPAYFVRSLTSNSADLMTEPLRVSVKETPEIHVGFGTTAPSPWVKVSGLVKGLDPAKGAFRVTLESNITSAIETYIDPEGKFEFPVVLKNTNYSARLVPANEAASTPRVAVGDKDVADVEIVAPAEREVTVRTTVEGDAPLPGFGLVLDGNESSMTVVVRPDADGTFKAKLPEDERRVRVNGLPLGYDVKSMTYDSTDLLEQPMKITESSGTTELKVALAVDAAVPWGSVRGRVTGLDPNAGSVTLALNGATTFSSFETSVSADGSFNFPRIPQGTYIPSLKGGIEASRLASTPIVVSGPDLAGIEIAAPRQTAGTPRSRIDEAPGGATVSDFGLSGRANANEAAAVANLRTINTALVTFLSATGGKYGNLEDLINAGLLDERFRGAMSGFNFSVITTGDDYAAAAIPTSAATGRFGFYSVPDAVVRYSTFEALSPPNQSGRAVQ
jgi:hypothetical protein